ncbi:putative outer membrane protein OmpA [hydrothermal vent metagenome]|uniref:Putative outer membrane protein OmpA n=1 Tax=hydrothermal vent metagenome TaxID=652676 RepID=A0A1W1BXT0_9ZZZZ
MKNIVLSAVAVAAMGTFAVAGGDIAPIQEPTVVVPEVVEEVTDAGFYLGLGYGALKVEQTDNYEAGSISAEDQDDADFDQLLVQVGYKFNSYVAIEGRYWFGMNDLTGEPFFYNGNLTTQDASLDAYGIYVKPMYPVTDAFDIYALLGYAQTTYDQTFKAGNATVDYSTDLDGFSWGLGVSYSFNDNVSIFADYTSLYDDTYDEYGATVHYTSDFTISTINVGVSYKF